MPIDFAQIDNVFFISGIIGWFLISIGLFSQGLRNKSPFVLMLFLASFILIGIHINLYISLPTIGNGFVTKYKFFNLLYIFINILNLLLVIIIGRKAGLFKNSQSNSGSEDKLLPEDRRNPVNRQDGGEFYTLFETARTINTLSSLAEVLDYSCHQLRKISSSDLVFIALRNDNESFFRIKSSCGRKLNINIIDQIIDVNSGIAKQAVIEKRSIQACNPQDDPLSKFDISLTDNIKCMLAAPIIFRNHVYGIIYIILTTRDSLFTDHTINLIDALANIIGIAAEKMGLLEDLNLQVQNLTDLMDVGSAVQGSLKQEEILHAIVEKSYQRFAAHTCQINLVHKEENWLEIAAFKGFTPKNTGRINNKAVYRYTSHCPVLSGENARIYTEQNGCPRFRSHDPIKSYICAPLKVGNEIFGVIHLTSLQENVFTKDDLTFLSSFAQEAGLAVQRGRLYEELALEKVKIETIMKSIDDPIIVLDSNGGLVMANDAFYFYFSIKPEQEKGKSFAVLMDECPYDITIESHDYMTLIKEIYTNAKSLTVTCTLSSSNNTFYNHFTLTPVLNLRREVTSMVALFHDVSDLQELLQRLNQEKENAEQANLLKTEFLANISHELRTPLNSIIGYTQCILDEVDGSINPEQTNDLNKVLSNAENLLRLINDILDLSKLELDHTEVLYEQVNPAQLVNEAIKTIKPLADARGLSIHTCLTPVDEIHTDSFRLQQILINLLSNAVKFTHIGYIRVETNINLVPGYITFLISDTGIGFSKQVQEFIFDRFRQADGSITRKYGGTGLGLSICKNLVQLLGGNIWASSEPGVGSTFYFTLPLYVNSEIQNLAGRSSINEQ